MTKKRRNELILIGVIIVIAIGYIIFTKVSTPKKGKGAEVVVQVGGYEYARLPLNVDTELEIVSGDFSNTLVIKDGIATVTEANCPDKLCTYQPSISRPDEMIICLPHEMLVIIVSDESNLLDGKVQ